MEESKFVLFTNWTNEDFTHTWAKEPFTFKANSTQTLPSYLAEHFAKHLADRELNNEGIPTDTPKKDDYIAKCLGGQVSSNLSAEKALVEAMNPEIIEKKEEAPKNKGGRPKKVVVEEVNEDFEE